MKTTLGLILLAVFAGGAAATAYADDFAKDRAVVPGGVATTAHKRHGTRLPLARPKLHEAETLRFNNNANPPDYYTIQRESLMKNSM
jgi:hypothetical protein